MKTLADFKRAAKKGVIVQYESESYPNAPKQCKIWKVQTDGFWLEYKSPGTDLPHSYKVFWPPASLCQISGNRITSSMWHGPTYIFPEAP